MYDERCRALTHELSPALNALQQYRPYMGEAAVLMGLLEREQRAELILTERAAHLTQHPSEVAFPGGKFERTDTDLIATALREAHEETQLEPSRVALLGALPARYTRAGVRVSAVVAQVAPGAALVADPSELNTVFNVPLDLFQPAYACRFDSFERDGRRYRVPAYQFKHYTIWGLTALLATELAAAFYSPTDAATGL